MMRRQDSITTTTATAAAEPSAEAQQDVTGPIQRLLDKQQLKLSDPIVSLMKLAAFLVCTHHVETTTAADGGGLRNYQAFVEEVKRLCSYEEKKWMISARYQKARAMAMAAVQVMHGLGARKVEDLFMLGDLSMWGIDPELANQVSESLRCCWGWHFQKHGPSINE